MSSRRPRRWIGFWIIAVGVLHTGLGIALFHATLGDIARDGFWNTIDGHPGRPVAFWFLVAGLLFVFIGALVDWLEMSGGPLPGWLGWVLLALAGIFAVLMPASGAWLFLPPALATLRRADARRRTAPPG